MIFWALLCLAAACGLRVRWLDASLRAHRAATPGVLAHAFGPFRWRRSLYTPAGQALVRQLWWTAIAGWMLVLLALAPAIAASR